MHKLKPDQIPEWDGEVAEYYSSQEPICGEGKVSFTESHMYINHTPGQTPFPGVVDQWKQDSIFVGQGCG